MPVYKSKGNSIFNGHFTMKVGPSGLCDPADTCVSDGGVLVESISGNPHTVPDNWKTGNTDIDELQIGNTCTSIGVNAFFNCENLEGSLTIPDSVTIIGSNAFSGCSGFDGSLTIGNSVTTIGSYAFYNCLNLTGSLTIPNSVTTIGDYAFAFCSNITNVDCYVTETIFDQLGVLQGSGVTTIHVCSDDVTWTVGAGQTIGGKSGITVIKDLVCGTTTTTTTVAGGIPLTDTTH
jgi:hypothetical protein